MTLPFPPAAGMSPPLVVINDIQVTATHIVTPAGTFPTAGAQWSVVDASSTRQEIPQWAIVCAIVGFFLVCALSLLFLLVKEPRTTGTVHVSVSTPYGGYTTTLPAVSPAAVADVHNRVAYARTITG